MKHETIKEAFFETHLRKAHLYKRYEKNRPFLFITKIASKEALEGAIFETHLRKVQLYKRK